MSAAFDKPNDPAYKEWTGAFESLNKTGSDEDAQFFKEASRELGLSDEAINRLLDNAREHFDNETNRAQVPETETGRGAAISGGRHSFRQNLVDHFRSPEPVAEATSHVVDALARTWAKLSGGDPADFYKRIRVGGKADKGGLEQADTEPAFYSQLTRSLESQTQGKFTPEQLEAVLRKTVKPDEMKWTGFDDFIREKKAKGERVTKEEALEFARQNAVEVREVEKMGRDEKEVARIDEQMDALHEQGDINADQALGDEYNRLQALRNRASGMAKFGGYQVPGGENYRELLLTLPNKEFNYRLRDGGLMTPAEYEALTPRERKMVGEGKKESITSKEYKSAHFDEPNVLAHIRFNERTDAGGQRVLFIEEIQSDWHQEGRKKGYRQTGAKLSRAEDQRLEFLSSERNHTAAESREFNSLWARASEEGNGVPDAPFKKTWHELAMKRAIRWASENGFDRVAWTTGEQQAERYDLSKHIDSIKYIPNGDGTFNVFTLKGHEIPWSDKRATPKTIEDTLGKEIADKITKDPNEGLLTGLDLKVGEEGMKGFYDKILPEAANKLGKKFGARVGESKVKTGEPNEYAVHGAGEGKYGVYKMVGEEFEGPVETFDSFGKAAKRADELQQAAGGTPVHSLDITPEMRASAMEGQPLFQEARAMANFMKDGTGVITALNNPNESSAAHEIHHVAAPEFMKLSEQLRASGEVLPTEGKQFVRDMHHMARWMGLNDVAEFNKLHDAYVADTLKGDALNRYVEAQEKGARGFERYLRTGRAPTPQLKAVFEQFKEWLHNIYHGIRGTVKGTDVDVPISREQQATWDRLLGGTGEIAKGGTQVKQETIQQERVHRGTPEIEREGAREWGDVWDEVKSQVDKNTFGATGNIRDFAAEIAKKPRVLSDKETAALAYDRARLKNEYDDVEAKAAHAINENDEEALGDLNTRLSRIETDLQNNDMAGYRGGTEWGRAGAIRQLLAKEDYSFERLVTKATVKKGEHLSPDEKSVLRDLAKKYQDVSEQLKVRDAELAEFQKKNADLERPQYQQQKVDGWRPSKGSRRPKEAVLSDMEKIKAQFAKLAEQAGAKPAQPEGLLQADKYRGAAEDESPLTPEMRKLVKQMARLAVEGGARTPEEVNDQAHGMVFQHFPELTPRETADIWSDYGKKAVLSQDELDVAMREAKRLQKDLNALDDLSKGELPLRSGLQRDKPSQRHRELTRSINEQLKKLGWKSEREIDPEEQWKTTQQALHTKLRNQVEDLDRQIEAGEGPAPRVEKLKKAYDDETVALMAERDLLKRQLNDPIVQNKVELKAQLVEAERKLSEGDLGRVDKKTFPPEIYDDAEATQLRAKLKDAQGKLSDARNEPKVQERLRDRITDLQRRIRERDFSQAVRSEKVATPETKALRAERDELNRTFSELRGPRHLTPDQQITATEKALEKSIERMRKNAPTADKTKISSPWTKRIGEMQTELDALREARRPEIALKGYKTRVQKSIDEYQRQLDEKDFAPKPKRAPLKLDAEADALKTRQGAIKRQVEREMNKLDWAGKTKTQKALAYTAAGVRAGVLSGVGVVGKIGSALAQRLALSPMENIAGEGWKRILPKIAEQAPRHGAGINWRAEGEALKGVVQGAKEMPRMLMTGETDLSLQHGKEHSTVPGKIGTVLAIPGRIHAAEKNLAKHAEFNRSLRMNLDWVQRRGFDPNDPNVRAECEKRAYRDSEETVLLGENAFSKSWSRAESGWSDQAKSISRIIAPVRKVPANYVAQTVGEYLLGVPRGALRALQARKPGMLEKMTPEEADKTMRLLNRGTVGLIAAAIGGAGGAKIFGGYFQRGEKQDEDKPHPGDIKIGPLTISHRYSHSPTVEVAQVFATMRREFDEARAQGDSFGESLKQGALGGGGASARGLGHQVPFLGQYTDVVEALESAKKVENILGKLVAGWVEPQIMKEFAGVIDREEAGAPTRNPFKGEQVKRKPEGFTEQLKAGIPFVRESVDPATPTWATRVSAAPAKTTQPQRVQAQRVQAQR